jgi:hypothetical protein
MQPRKTMQLLLAATVALLLAGCGLTAPRSNDGYADLDSLGMLDVDHVITLSLGPTVLRLAASAMDDDPDTRAMLRSLDGVRIRIYQIDGDAGRVAARAERMQRRLQAQDWEPVILVQESGERTYMLLKVSDARICGLTVITADHEEAVIVNIMGEIRPEMFNDTMAALDYQGPQVQVASTH